MFLQLVNQYLTTYQALEIFVSQAKLLTSIKKGKSDCHSAHQITPMISIFCLQKIQFQLQTNWTLKTPVFPT